MELPWRYPPAIGPWRAPAVVSAQFRCISDDPLGVGGDRGRVVALKTSSFSTTSLRKCGLIVALKLVVSAPVQFVGFVATPKRMTLTVDAGCRGDETSSFGTILIRR